MPKGSYFGDFELLNHMPCLYLVKSAGGYKEFTDESNSLYGTFVENDNLTL